MSRSVVDASVAAKWFLPEVHADAARRLLQGQYELLVPDLLFAEVANMLWKRVRRAEMTVEEASSTLQELGSLPLQVFPSWPLAAVALGIAGGTQHTLYESVYLGLAVQSESPLVTADRKLYDAVRGTFLASFVRWVEDVQKRLPRSYVLP